MIKLPLLLLLLMLQFWRDKVLYILQIENEPQQNINLPCDEANLLNTGRL